MISKQFKKTIIKRLKTDYDVVCHGIELTDVSTVYQTYSLSCSANRRVFSLKLMVAICPVDTPSRLYTFEVCVQHECLYFITNISAKMKIDLLFKAIAEVREDFSYLNPSYEFRLPHNSITLLSGQYFVGSSYFEIKSIINKILTISCLQIYNFESDRALTCAAINIDGDKISVRPWTMKQINPIFLQHSLIEVGGLDIFKANLAKCVFLFFNDTEDDYMQLDYTDMKRYLLVYKMESI